jgi:NADH-quinone oxidoreductase subunit J
MVLYVFVVAYVGGTVQELGSGAVSARMRFLSVLFAGVLFAELAIAVLGSGLSAIDSDGPNPEAGFGTPARIGELLLTRFLLPFEAASFLLLIAAVGAVVLARRRGGLEPEDEQRRLSVYDVVRPAESGTMAEAVGPAFSVTAPQPRSEEDRG